MAEGLRQTIEENLEATLMAFQVAYATGTTPQLDAGRFSPEGQAAILELWERVPFRCNATYIPSDVARVGTTGLYEFRGVTLNLFEADGEAVTEQAVFILDARDGRIIDFKFGIPLHRADLIQRDGRKIMDLNDRFFLLNFIENFRTAYNRKDVSYLEKVFSDDALIIVGKLLEARGHTDMAQSVLNRLGEQRVEFIRRSKAEYLDNLRRVFEYNQYIKVDFVAIGLYEHAEYKKLYVVQLDQRWRSYSDDEEGYSDEGYLFLLIDLRKDTPLIHVRTWQPKEGTDPELRIGLDTIDVFGDQ